MPELNRRYVVMALGAEAPFDPHDPNGVFVLKPWKDPAALQALRAYRDNCYEELAQDLDQWIEAIEMGPQTRGGVGSRNEQASATRRKPAIKAKAKSKPKAKVVKSLKKKAKRRS